MMMPPENQLGILRTLQAIRQDHRGDGAEGKAMHLRPAR